MRVLRSGLQVSVYVATVTAHSDSLLLVGRLFLVAAFLYGGVAKLVGWRAAVAEFDALGVAVPAFAAAATVAVQLLDGAAIVDEPGIVIDTAHRGELLLFDLK